MRRSRPVHNRAGSSVQVMIRHGLRSENTRTSVAAVRLIVRDHVFVVPSRRLQSLLAPVVPLLVHLLRIVGADRRLLEIIDDIPQVFVRVHPSFPLSESGNRGVFCTLAPESMREKIHRPRWSSGFDLPDDPLSPFRLFDRFRPFVCRLFDDRGALDEKPCGPAFDKAAIHARRPQSTRLADPPFQNKA